MRDLDIQINVANFEPRLRNVRYSQILRAPFELFAIFELVTICVIFNGRGAVRVEL